MHENQAAHSPHTPLLETMLAAHVVQLVGEEQAVQLVGQATQTPLAPTVWAGQEPTVRSRMGAIG